MVLTPRSTLGIIPVAMFVAVTFGCGSGSSSTPNPVPAISSISPSTATRGGPLFTLTVNGSNFVSGAAVQWSGSARQTTFVNAQQVTAQISADDISVAVRTMCPRSRIALRASFGVSPS